MALLNRGNAEVIVHADFESTDSDGNPNRVAAAEGVPMTVMIQPRPQSGTSARRAEEDSEGFESEEIYRMRFRRGEDMNLGPESHVIWRGQKWTVAGWPLRFMGSTRTEHIDYVLKRT